MTLPTLRACFAAFAAVFFPFIPASGAVEAVPEPAQLDFFEKKIRPVLVNHCYQCHSTEANKSKGGLLLDTREAARQGGDSGHAVVPGNAEESLILEALKWENKELRMPPEKEGGRLPDAVIADFEKWIAMGAPDPRGSSTPVAVKKPTDITEARNFWSFQVPREHAAPAVKDSAWPKTDIDRFILAAQEAKNLHPVEDADKRDLLRRVYFDLIGLPPPPAQIEAFLQDQSPEAFAKVVDSLLASPQFGERWGRHWLDVARYAESTGKERNFTMPAAWRYRDYVIASLNADKPYDEFIREQIAGDLLPAKDIAERNEHLVATGFLALGPKGLNERNKEQFRVDLIDEQIDATTRAVLGFTVACARCHDHKFDPVSQEDYYALAGIFRSTQTFFGTGGGGAKAAQQNRHATPLIPLAKPEGAPSTEAAAPAESAKDAVAAAPADESSEEEVKSSGEADVPANFEQRLRAAAANRPKLAQRLKNMSREEMIRAYRRFAENAPGAAQNPKKKRKFAGAAAIPAPTGDECMGVADHTPANARLLVRGEISQPAEAVPRGFIRILNTNAPPQIPPEQSGRLQLAGWLTAPTNPLTARVAVNRVWLHLFGQGLVTTPDNFGYSGALPSHPELLDHLAATFVRDGWSIKRLVRSIVVSRVYQLSSRTNAVAQQADPDNRLLWRASPRRLDAEAIRDAMLAASGQLNLNAPKGSIVSEAGNGYVGRGITPERFTNASATYRSVYLPIVRDFVPDVLDTFDFAEPSLVVAARDVTNVPAQALFLLNNTFVREQSAAMAQRILATPASHPQRISLAYELALGRRPTEAERKRAEAYLLSEARELIPIKAGRKDEAAELSWSTFCQALFASAEFRYLK